MRATLLPAVLGMFSVIALAGPATSQEARQPAPDGAVSFLNDIVPLLSSRGCNATECHGAVGGKGQFALSMFGADPDADYLAIVKSDRGRRVNRIEPDRSLVLLKATGAIEHGGKQRIEPDTEDHAKLRAWLEARCPQADPTGRQVTSIEVAPQEVRLAKDEARPLSVAIVFSDGSRRDVTDTAVYQAIDDSVVKVTGSGRVEAIGFGQTHVLATFNRQSAVVRVSVPQPLDSPFPQAEVHNKLDELVLAKLEELGIPPAAICSDQEFLRRVHLDMLGRLPAPEEIRGFLSDKDPKKREKLIDRLMERSEFADFCSLKWGDLLRIKAEYPSNLWPNAVQAYYEWVRDSVAENKPYDEMVRELLVSTGSNFREPPVNFYRAMKKRDPQGFAETASLVFMGARIDCARCHGHPAESWTLDDNLGMAAFFSQVKFKSSKEWKEEIVYLDPTLKLRHPKTRQEVQPKLLGGETLEIAPGADPRDVFAQWLTSPDNPWFARNIVNRIWFWLLGRGIVHEPDDMRPTNPPSNPELLAYLEKELVDQRFDLRHIYRLILNSATYQRSSKASELNAWDSTHFSHYPIRRLTAEQMSDAIGEITGVWDKFSSRIPEPYSYWPEGFRAVQMSDGSVSTPFLELFGRPPRDTAYESDRDCETSMRQALYMITSAELEAKVNRSPRIRALLKSGKSNEEIVEELFLLTVSRFPTEAEMMRGVAHLSKDPKNRSQALQDLMWALLNTKEFLFNH